MASNTSAVANTTAKKDARTEMQKKTFQRWMNMYLKKRGQSCEEFPEDLQNGVLLCELCEIIGKDSIKSLTGKKYNKKPKMKIQMLENGNFFLEYMKAKEMTFTNVGSNDIYEKNEKIILGMLWKIILRFVVAEDGMKGLLLWCQRSTKEYDNINIENFTRSFGDGLGLVGLIHHFKPDLIADPRTLDAANAADNCELAFNVAEKSLGIDRLLDVEDIAGQVADEKSVVAYISQLYQKFAAQMKSENYVKTIEKALAITRLHEKLIDKYKSDAAESIAWIEGATTKYDPENVELPGASEEIRALLADFNTYRKTDKADNKEKKEVNEGILTQVKSSARNHNRPIYEPEESITPASIDSAWDALEANEKAYEGVLRRALTKFEDLEHKVQKVTLKVQKINQWCDGQGHLETEPTANSVDEAENNVATHKIFEQQLDNYKSVLGGLEELKAVFKENPGQCGTDAAVEAYDACAEKITALENVADQYKAKLLLQRDTELQARELQAAVARDGEQCLMSLDTIEDMRDEPVVATSLESIAKQSKVLADDGPCREALLDLKMNQGVLVENFNKLKELGKEPNCRTEVSAFVANEGIINEQEQLIAQKQKELDDLKKEEEDREQLRKAFAEQAEVVTAGCKTIREALAGAADGTLDEQLEKVTHLSQDMANGENLGSAPKAALAAAEKINEDLNLKHIIINPYTGETMESLRSAWKATGDAVKDQSSSLNDQILAEQGSQITPEQLKEFREVGRRRAQLLSLVPFAWEPPVQLLCKAPFVPTMAVTQKMAKLLH